MGLPAVGTAIYGLTDAVVDGETGILVPPRNDHALLEALKRLIDHPDELETLPQISTTEIRGIHELGLQTSLSQTQHKMRKTFRYKRRHSFL